VLLTYARSRRPVDVQVYDDHEDEREVERTHCREDSVAPTLTDDALEIKKTRFCFKINK